MKGRLIVLEGTDGSGKSTQFSLLCRRMEEAKKPFHRIVFPQYREPSSALVRMYLGGEFGSHPDDVNAYAASTFYAVDRYASYKKVWGADYERGGLILADRYTTSNAVHQTSKLPEEAWAPFLRWLFDFEYDKLGLPAPDHEVDTGYLRRCREAALAAAGLCGWERISCVDEQGAVRPPEDIHQQIWDRVSALL